MRYVIVDLATTCWEKLASPEGMEMIEIGAVLLPSSSEAPISEYAQFIRPSFEPQLSTFCESVTCVRQGDIDQAPSFKTVLYDLLDWIGPYPFRLCFWGERDLAQIKQDCDRHHIACPPNFERPISIKKAFAEWKGIPPCTLPRALQMMGYVSDRTDHPSLSDAWDIAKIAGLVLPLME